MLRRLDDLYRSVLADYSGIIDGQRDLRHAYAPFIFIVIGSGYPKDRLHRHREVRRCCAVAKVDVDES